MTRRQINKQRHRQNSQAIRQHVQLLNAQDDQVKDQESFERRTSLTNRALINLQEWRDKARLARKEYDAERAAMVGMESDRVSPHIWEREKREVPLRKKAA